ncbi:MAG TPA: MFS transporter [Actinomycetota bacterium]|nr:MFS transporter [Actinomycetota bacterium]
MTSAVPEPVASSSSRELRREALRFVVALGVLSLFADMVYEGARSILGPFLVTLGASAAAVGLISGVGEFVGYALRVGAGYAADRTRRYWALTIGGYLLTLVAVPLLGLVGRVDLAFALVIAERLGKAIRTPSRDTLLAHASHGMGRGVGFGLHEALDQIGAVLSPLLLSAVLAARVGDYGLAFGVLAVPGLFAFAAMMWARFKVPDPARFEPAAGDASHPHPSDPSPLRSETLRRYFVFVFVATLGFAPFPLIAFHLTTRGVLSDSHIPLLFAAAMAIDAAIALGVGRLYDRKGLIVLVSAPMATSATLLLFTGSAILAWIGAAIWGGVLGLQESTLRTAVGDLVRSGRRAIAYGWFNTAYGLSLLLAGSLLGALYERSIMAMAGFILISEVAALVVFARLRKSSVAERGARLA